MGLASFNAMRRRQEEEANEKPRKNAAAPPDIWAVMKVGKAAALKLFKGADHDDPEQAAKDYVDEVMAGGNTTREDLSIVKRD